MRLILFSDESVARSLTKSPELQKLSEENANDDAKHLDYGRKIINFMISFFSV